MLSKPSKISFKNKSGRVAFQHKDYRFFWMARVLGVLAIDMQITAISWQVYQLTGKALDLGLVGLAQFLPFLMLFLVSGSVADRYQRKKILSICVVIQTLCALAFFIMTITGNANFPIIFKLIRLSLSNWIDIITISPLLKPVISKNALFNFNLRMLRIEASNFKLVPTLFSLFLAMLILNTSISPADVPNTV